MRIFAFVVCMCLLVELAMCGTKDEHSKVDNKYKRKAMRSLTREDRLAARNALIEQRNRPVRALCMKEFRAAYAANASRVFIQVLGMHASGTNYAFKMMVDNGFDVGMVPGCASTVGSACLEHTALWKHQDPNTIGTHPDFTYDAERYFFVVMVRHPFSWYASLLRNSYDYAACRHTATPECRFLSGGPCMSTPDKERNVWSQYSSFWQAWGEHYTRMLHSRHFRLLNATYVRYEDLALTPGPQLARIRHVALKRGVQCTGHCATNDTWSVVMKPAKLHGSHADHKRAVSDILSKSYKDIVPEEVMRSMCSHNETRHIMTVFDYIDDCSLFGASAPTHSDDDASSLGLPLQNTSHAAASEA